MYTAEAEEALLSGSPDFVVDAIDNIDTKVGGSPLGGTLCGPAGTCVAECSSSARGAGLWRRGKCRQLLRTWQQWQHAQPAASALPRQHGQRAGACSKLTGRRVQQRGWTVVRLVGTPAPASSFPRQKQLPAAAGGAAGCRSRRQD
jgi:hypothetical protein